MLFCPNCGKEITVLIPPEEYCCRYTGCGSMIFAKYDRYEVGEHIVYELRVRTERSFRKR